MASPQQSDSEHNTYFLNRDWQSSARLSLQHFVTHARLGYLIHPTIERSIQHKQAPRILDLGAGTGIWAIEACRRYQNATVLGLDIADNQFPPAGTLPANLTFSKYSFFDPVPLDLANSFDVVHVSLIMAALYRGGRSTVIKNIHKFLKPGGWVQWHEILIDQDIVLDPNTLQPAGELQSFKFSEKHMGVITANDWCRDMPKYLVEEGGFVDADLFIPRMDPVLLSLETQLLLWNTLEFMSTLGRALGTEEAKRDAQEAIEDTQRQVRDGKVLHWKFLVGFARRSE